LTLSQGGRIVRRPLERLEAVVEGEGAARGRQSEPDRWAEFYDAGLTTKPVIRVNEESR
jgi:hypothetical protein